MKNPTWQEAEDLLIAAIEYLSALPIASGGSWRRGAAA